MNTTKNEHKKCLLCNSQRISALSGFEKAHLCTCQSCGFVFAQKIPTQKELVEHYEGYQRNDYLSPITIKRYHELLDKFEPYRKTGRILDVGCGIGYFLEVAKERNWKVYGTEYTDDAIKICSDKGITMQQGKLDPNGFEPGSFDIITSFEVIEHINNPLEEINNFNKLLRIGGLVYVTTPNFNSLLRYRLKDQYNVITYPEHLSYYTPKTIKRLFVQRGFKKLSITTTGISLTRLKTSKGTSSQAFISADSDDEQLRNQIETKWHLQLVKKIINTTLSLLGVGDSLKGWFIKTH